MSSSYTFNWPSGPKEVIVTGTFDNWAKTLPLVKQTDGSFELTVPFAKDTKVLYKYIVDGEWLTNSSQAVDKDANGIENNVLTSEHLSTSGAKSKIPEAGGLAVAAGDLKTTVLPSKEGQQTTLGEPGIFIPKDEESLSAFTKFENTDRNLNGATEKSTETPALTPEEKKKQKKKLKRTKYKLNKKARANGENPTSTSTESTPAPEEDVSKKSAIAGGAAGATAAGAAAISAVEGHKDKAAVEKSANGVTANASATIDDEKEPAPYALKEKDLDASTVVVPTEKKSVNAPDVATEKPDAKSPEVKTPDVKTALPEADKKAAPYSLDEKDLTQPKIAPEVEASKAKATDVSGEKTDVKTPALPETDKEAAPYSLNEKDLTQAKIVPETKAPETKAPETKVPETKAVDVSAENSDAKAIALPEADKEAAPYSLKEKDLSQSKIVPGEVKATEESKNVESQNTLDPTVVGVVGAAAGASASAGTAEEETKSADVLAAEISGEKSVEPKVKPAINEPIEAPKDLAASAEDPVIPSKDAPTFPAQLAPFSNIEDVPVAPVSNHAKEVTALPVNGEKFETEEEIIIAQGGHDPKAIEKQIIASEDGPVSVEEIQPTVSEAKKLAEEAHIPSDEIKAEPVPVKHKKASSSSGKSDSGKTSSNGKSSKTDSKEKKKRGFFSKLKKIFK